MNIVVIVKRADSNNSNLVKPKLDPNDFWALKLAVNLREINRQIHRVTAVCIAPYESSTVIRECFALGADEGILLDDPLFERIDEEGAINILSSAVDKLERSDLVIMSSGPSDKITPGIGAKIAEKLKLEYADFVEKFKLNGHRLNVVRASDARGELEKTLNTPVLLNMVCSDDYQISNSTRIMQTFKKHVSVWNSHNLSLDSNLRPKKRNR